MIERFTRTCTEDGTWIVLDPETGLSASSRYLLDAIAELRRLVSSCAARDAHVHAREAAA